MKVVIAVICLCLLGPAAWAETPAGEPALSAKEKESLRLAREWMDNPTKPLRGEAGKVVYAYESGMATVFAAPMEISDIELQAGETVNEILVGDTARWQVESGTSGSGLTHVFVKPMEAGLRTSLVVTTDKRTYHIRLVSQKEGHTPYTSFIYQKDVLAAKAQQAKQQTWATAEIGGREVDLSGLDFNYKVMGTAPWKPARVYNDGHKTFIKLPDSAAHGEAPVLLAKSGGKERLVNYRFRNNAFEVDGLFDRFILVSGVGQDQERVEIRKGSAQ